MITFNYLGYLGRLGNQMFQYAALRGICSQHNYDYTLPKNVVDNPQMCIYLYDCFNISDLDRKVKDWSDYDRRLPSKHEFDPDFFYNCPPKTDLFGYFQTEKYFENIEDIIRKEYTFKDHIVKESKQYFDNLFSSNEVIALHIRRTDYVNNDIMRVLKLSYYRNALSYFDSNIPVLVFSDDIDWCKTQEIFSDKRFKFSKNTTFVDLCLMSMCKYHIIANSTFSWWGSWLAKSKKTICPREWYFTNKVKEPNFYLPDYDWNSTDICRTDWVLL